MWWWGEGAVVMLGIRGTAEAEMSDENLLYAGLEVVGATSIMDTWACCPMASIAAGAHEPP